MKDNETVLEAELEYAVKMVRAGYASVDQAARVCGVQPGDLQARLAAITPQTGAQPCHTP